MVGGGAGGPGGPHGIRRRRQGRAAPPRDRARDLGPERDLLVAQAPQALAGAAASPSRLVPSRQKHDELGRMANGAGARACLVAAAEEEVGARRSHNR